MMSWCLLTALISFISPTDSDAPSPYKGPLFSLTASLIASQATCKVQIQTMAALISFHNADTQQGLNKRVQKLTITAGIGSKKQNKLKHISAKDGGTKLQGKTRRYDPH